MLVADVDELIATAGEVTRKASAPVKEPVVALLFDCISRCLLMEDDFIKELVAIGHGLGDKVPLMGTLTFGEIGSYVDVPLLHNKTTAIAVLGDGAGPNE